MMSTEEMFSWNLLGEEYWTQRTRRQRWIHMNILYPCVASYIRNTDLVLDYGCGGGDMLLYIRSLYPEAKLWGYDRSSAMRDIAKATLGSDAIANDLSEIDGGFNRITLNMVLQDIEQPVDMLRRLRSLLAVDGMLIITVPHPTFSLIEGQHVTTRRERIAKTPRSDIYRYLHEEAEKVYWDASSDHHTLLYNRTLPTYIAEFKEGGLYIDDLVEPLPVDDGGERDLYVMYTEIPKLLVFVLKALR